MNHTSHIQELIKNPEVWGVLFIAAGLLGVYLSIIILAFQRIRRQHTFCLGIYMAALAMLLLHLASHFTPLEYFGVVLQSCGAASLFLLGPISSMLMGRGRCELNTPKTFLQLLPLLAAAILAQIHDRFLFWIYLGGMLSIGAYLTIQLVSVFHKNTGPIARAWIKGYTLLQVLLYLIIVAVGIYAPAIYCLLTAAISLILLILVVWIRLLHTAIILYIK